MAIGAIVGAGKRLAKKVATKAKAAKDTPKQAAARATRQRSVDRMDAHEGAPRRSEAPPQRDVRLMRAEIDEEARLIRGDAAQAARGGSSRARKVGTAVGGAGVAAGAVAADRDKKRRRGGSR